MSSNHEDKLDLVRRALASDLEDWVLFDNGTVIVFPSAAATDDIRQAAIDVMRERGEVVPGTPSADFQVTALERVSGWMVRGNLEGMYVYVQPDELDSDAPNDIEIGMFARTIRQLDHEDLEVLHVQRAAD